MAKRKWKIHVHRFNGTAELLLEQLRYAGILSIDKDINGNWMGGFTIYPPNGVDSETWAKMNTDRMRSFSIHACME